MKNTLPISRLMVFVSAAIMIAVYFVPFWQILMWAPQYPEGLTMKIWISKLSGDVEIINGLNHYIGMKHIKEEMFPEFKIMPYLLGGIIVFGMIAGLLGKKSMLWGFFALLILAGAAGIYDFYQWGADYGHNLDPTAPIKVPGMSYQPPVIGTKVLLNFTAYSGPDTGGWIMVASGILIMGALAVETFKNKVKVR